MITVTDPKPHRCDVAIIGAGPAGLLLGHMLALDGISSITIERQPRGAVLARIRAGVLEDSTVGLLRAVGLGGRLDREAADHAGVHIAWQGHPLFLIDTQKYTGRSMTAYGQTALTEDLFAARDQAGAEIFDGASDVTLRDLDRDRPTVSFSQDGRQHHVTCRFIAGCDGFHGVARKSIPAQDITLYDRAYPFGWLGVMVERPPLPHIIYAQHERGFALASQRNPMLSRYYIQCPIDTRIEDWPDDRFWQELKSRFPDDLAAMIETGPSIEKSIAPLRSFVSEPMRHGRLFLAGDAAHIVPPTGAKGLNLAVSDVYYLHDSLRGFFEAGTEAGLIGYSARALRRIWSAERLSWWLTRLLHVFPDQDPFETRLIQNEFEHLLSSNAAQASLAERFVGLPY